MTEPVIPVPAPVAAWLHRRLPHGLAVLVAGRDPALDRVLAAFRSAALVQLEQQQRTVQVTRPSPSAEQQQRWVNTTTAAHRLGISPHGVRIAVRRGRLHAREVDGRLHFAIADLDTYAAHRHERRTA